MKNWIDWLLCIFVLTTVVLVVLTLVKLHKCCKGEGYTDVVHPYSLSRTHGCVQVQDGSTPYCYVGNVAQINCVKNQPCYGHMGCIESDLREECGVQTVPCPC
jgi:hypothetical protein